MLSGKRIKKYTTEEFGFQLSSNAFAALKDRVDSLIKSSLYDSDQLDDWVMRILKASALLNKSMIRKQDIELIFDEIRCDAECETYLQKESDEKIQEDVNININLDEKFQDDISIDVNVDLDEKEDECSKTDSAQVSQSQVSFNPENNDIGTIKSDQQNGWRNVEIIQSASKIEVDQNGEEVERLKKIIQIILNKQAELTL